MVNLNSYNYSIWMCQMKDILLCKELYDLLEGACWKPETKEKEKDKELDKEEQTSGGIHLVIGG